MQESANILYSVKIQFVGFVCCCKNSRVRYDENINWHIQYQLDNMQK